MCIVSIILPTHLLRKKDNLPINSKYPWLMLSGLQKMSTALMAFNNLVTDHSLTRISSCYKNTAWKLDPDVVTSYKKVLFLSKLFNCRRWESASPLFWIVRYQIWLNELNTKLKVDLTQMVLSSKQWPSSREENEWAIIEGNSLDLSVRHIKPLKFELKQTRSQCSNTGKRSMNESSIRANTTKSKVHHHSRD
jgi:hypothetical protein